MIEGIEEPLQRIADGIAAAIEEPWTSATVEAVFYPGNSDYQCDYVRTDGRMRGFFLGMEAMRAIKAIRKLFKASGQPVWGQAKFSLTSEGKFSMQWGYEDLDAEGNTRWDPDAYDRRYAERSERLKANW